jgi:integrase
VNGNLTTPGDLTFLVTALHRAFSSAGFGNKLRQWCDEAGLTHCSAHGLRKAAAARLAELAASEHEIMAITGHRASKEVTSYTRAARQKILAERSMARLAAGQTENKVSHFKVRPTTVGQNLKLSNWRT